MKTRSKEEIEIAFLNAIDRIGEQGITSILKTANYEHFNGREYIKTFLDQGMVEMKKNEISCSRIKAAFYLTEMGRLYLNSLTQENLLMHTK